MRVAAIACGQSHAIAATLDEPDQPGAIFSWGCGHGRGSRLGFEVEDGVDVGAAEPRTIEWLSSVLAEEPPCAATRSAEPSAQPTRRRSSLRLPQRVTQLGCGARHSAVLCQGVVVCFGDDDCGQLGLTQPGEQSSIFGVDLPAFASAPTLTVPGASQDCRGAEQGKAEHSNGCGKGAEKTVEVAARRLCCGPMHTAVVSADGHLHVWGFPLAGPEPLGPEMGGAAGVWLVPGFGARRPVVALACGAHFVVASAEVELVVCATAPVACGRDPVMQLVASNGRHPVGRQHAWRPANLPRKTESEWTHHETLVKELERHIERKLEREHREERQRRSREERRERRLKEHTEIWMTELLPSYVPGGRPQRKVEHFWRQGLPPRVREVLWPRAIGNVLRITPELFDIYSKQAADARRQDEAVAADVLVTLAEPRRSHGREQSTKCIPFDLPRTFPTLAFFSVGGPLHQDCARILEAYTFFRPDIGYVQGMSFLAAMLLLYLPPYPAFVCLCNLINTPSVLGLYRLEPRAVECRSLLFRRLCAAQLPAVSQRLFDDIDLRPELFLIEWFMTLFSKCLPIDSASVIWDLFFLDGEVVLYCTALALLRMSEPKLLSDEGADLEGCVKILGEELRERSRDPDEVLWHVSEVWCRAPLELLTEIQNIEAIEFSPTTNYHSPHVDYSGAAGARGAARTLLAVWRGSRLSRWLAP